MRLLTIQEFPSQWSQFNRSSQRNHLLQAGLLFLMAVCVALLPASTGAQTLGSGSIQGTITDPSGAVVQQATVTAVDPETGRTVIAHSTKAGFYVLSALPPATYKITISASGFQDLVREGVTVNAFATVGLDLQLKLGHADETVTVSSLPPQIDTVNGTLETEVPHEVYSTLPIAMAGGPKSPLGFVNLAPGVSSGGNATFDLNGGAGEASQLYVNGMAAVNINIGGDRRTITDSTPLEAVSDFQVLTSGIPSYYTGDGVVNIVLKSGTNAFHGNAYENVRNTIFDAAGYFSATTPVEHQNEYGASLGGPILKNRLFFFFNYDGYRLLAGQNPVLYTIPTLAERQGDFSALPVPIYDPNTTQCTGNKCTRQKFPGNIIPTDRISSISNFLQAPLPAPINTSLANNYLGAYNNGLNQDMYTSKVDYSITKANRLMVLGQWGKVDDVGLPKTGPMLPLPYSSGRSSNADNRLFQVQDTQTITSNLINVVGYQYNRFGNPLQNATTSGNWAAQAGITGIPGGLASQDFPPINFSGTNSPTSWATYNYTASQLNVTSTNEAQDNLQWVHGRHDFIVGGELEFDKADQVTPSQLTAFNFSYAQTSGYSATGVLLPTQGNAYASYLLGNLASASLNDTTVPDVQGRFSDYALYVQDDWQVTHKLSLNLGLRYFIPKPFVEASNKMSFLNATMPNPAVGNYPGALQFAGSGTDSCHCATPVETHYLNLEPRVGFAFSPQNGTVLRGSFSIMNFKSEALGGTTPDFGQLGYAASPTFTAANAGGVAAFNWNNGVPAYTHAPFFDPTLNTGFNTTTGPTGGAITYPDGKHAGHPSYTDYWNATLQQQLTPSTAMSLSYAGSSSHRLALAGGYGIYSNQLDPRYLALGSLLLGPANATNLAAAQAIIPSVQYPYANFAGSIAQMLRPFPQYSGINDSVASYGTGHYDSMQVVVDHVESKGLFFHLAYTWSREIDNSGGEHARPNTAATLRNAYNISMDRAVSTDPTQFFTGAVSYLLPVGHGHALAFRSTALNNVVGGWRLSAIVSYHNGGYLGPFAAACLLPDAGSCYADYNPNFVGSARINGGYGSGQQNGGPKVSPVPYIDVKAFQNPAPFTYGTTPRIGAYGLKNVAGANEDLALDKTFSLYEQISLKLRADAFNVFNRTTLGGIVTNINSPAFGHVTTQANGPRQLQFEAYINF